MDRRRTREGATELAVTGQPDGQQGPAKAGQGFYNPAMAITRDLSVLAARAFDPPGRPTFLDGLAAAGARGLRVANETDDWQVTLNDRARRTANLARDNVDDLGLGDRVVVRSRPLNGLLAEGTWAMVDVDPYGSPVEFLAGALGNVADGGLVAVTATDATALHGVDEAPARRRYLAEPPPRHAPGWKDAAARLLVGAITREAARQDRAARPVLVHVHQHAFRAYVRVEEGARAADRALEEVAPVALCPDCYTWGLEACACGSAELTGPYYVGDLQDGSVLKAMADASFEGLACPGEVADLLDMLKGQAGMQPFYLDINRAVKARGLGGPPPRARLREALAEAGIETAQTHYGPQRLAYDGDPEHVLEVLEETARE